MAKIGKSLGIINEMQLQKTKVGLANQINSFVDYINNQTRLIVSKIKVQRAVFIGFLIHQEELKRGEKFNTFWKEISHTLESMACKFNSRSVLFEARRLYLTYKRFVNVIDGYLAIDNISVPAGLSIKHLLLIKKYCSNEEQQDRFIQKVKSGSLNANELKYQLLLGITSKGDDILLTIDDTSVKTSYDLSCLGIKKNWSENDIKKHIIKNIPIFIKTVLGPDWGFFPNKKINIGGRRKHPDLVFYNVEKNRYFIIDLKCGCLVSDIDRAKSQMISYVKAYDQYRDFTYQKKTIGLILGKKPIDSVYFNSTETPEYIFYSGFKI